MKTVLIQSRVYQKGRATCPCCGHKFGYILSAEQLLLWDRYCPLCSITITWDLPPKGAMIVERLEDTPWA